MIRPEELRIGNYFNWRGGDAPDEGYDMQVDFDSFYEIKNKPERFRPILLTEDWLINFGFVSWGSNGEYLFDLDNFWAITFYSDTGKFSVNHLNIELKYVHQLQNLYFSLTQEELTIKH